MDFYDFDLNDLVLDALDDMNFTDPTPIQEHAIAPILEGRDLIGIAQTGTGKTAAYLLPILSRLQDGGFPKDKINCIVMSPTRELAQQIDQAMQGFSYYLPDVSSVAVYGGNDGFRYDQELKSMQMGADVIIATPGRLISHLSLGNIDLSHVSFFVLDEADRMLDMGFIDDIMQIAKFLPEKKQTIMFSATMPPKIRDLAKSILRDPVEVKLAVSRPADKIHQVAYVCHEAQKIGVVKHIFSRTKPERVIIFTGSKIKTRDLAIALLRAGYKTKAMHSDLSQAERDEVMFQFRSGEIDIMVATDIVARGIDIDDIKIVINFDVPHDEEDYVHRIGRTARAGKDGEAITLVGGKDQPMFRSIERFLGKEVEKLPIPSELGEAPEYKVYENEKGGKRGGRPSSKKSTKNTSRKKGNNTPKSKKENATKSQKAVRETSTEQQSVSPVSSPDQDTFQGESPKPKKKRRYWRPRKKSE